MDNMQRLKLSNEVGMKVVKNDFPSDGKTWVTITLEKGQPVKIEVKNSTLKKRGE